VAYAAGIGFARQWVGAVLGSIRLLALGGHWHVIALLRDAIWG
jgi:hypothetical protein